MSNQSFLVCSSKRLIYPSRNEPRFDAKHQIIACGDWCVPLLWLSLFREDELKTGVVPVSSPLTHRRFAKQRVATATAALQMKFPKVATWEIHGELLLQAVEKSTRTRPYLSIEWDQIAVLSARQEFLKSMLRQMRFLAGGEARGASKLPDKTGLDWRRGFPNPLTAQLSEADEKNLAGLLGSDYEQAVPWWPRIKRPAGKRKSSPGKAQKETAKTAATLDPVSLKKSLRAAIEKRSETQVRQLVQGVPSLTALPFADLLEQAIDEQTYSRLNKIPDLLLARGIPVSPTAVCTAATDSGSFAQFKAMIARDDVDPCQAAKTVKSRISAPPIFWVACSNNGDVAVRKGRLLLAAGAAVDVRDSSGDWLLNQCLFTPACVRLFVPLASREHRLAALRKALDFRLAPLADKKVVDKQIALRVQFVRALHRSGIEEAAGSEAEILAKRANWKPVELAPYPYR